MMTHATHHYLISVQCSNDYFCTSFDAMNVHVGKGDVVNTT